MSDKQGILGSVAQPTGRGEINLGYADPKLLPAKDAERALRRSATDEQGVARIRYLYTILQHSAAVMEEAVALARQQDATWAEIGDALGGMSKQAAQERFGGRHR